MSTLVVYDSQYGNTKTIAEAIAGALEDAAAGEVTLLHARQANPAALEGVDLLVVGAPTHGGRATDDPQAFLKQIEAPALEGIRVAGFDTRLTAKWVKIFGYAGPKIAKELQEKGGTPAGAPGDFYVKGTKGPLVDGEVERAAEWSRGLAGAE